MSAAMADPVIDDIKQRIDIADLVGQTVQLKKAGRYLKGLCPFHRERTPSFYVYPDQGRYHCFGCGKSGDAFTWLEETEHLDFGEALRQLAQRTGVQLPERSAAPPDPAVQAAIDALQEAAAWFHQQLLQGQHEAAAAREYLAKRGLKRETVERFEMGWAPDRWDALVGHLRGKGLTPQQVEDAGLALSGERGLHDRFRGRVMFPIRSPEGKVTGFGGRMLGDGQPKYLNSPQTAFFDKSATLYALDQARPGIRKEGYAVIVEGYMDAVVPHQEGFTNVVASLGTALTEQQIGLLKRYTGTIVLALDADAAGQAATLRGLEVARQALFERRRPVPGLASRGGYLSLSAGQIKIAVLKGGKDPDEIVRESPQAWRETIAAATPMMEHKLNVELAGVDLSDPQSKLAAVRELARFLVQVPDRIEWGHYIDVIAQRLRLDVRAVRDEVSLAERAVRLEERRRERSAGAKQEAASRGASPVVEPDPSAPTPSPAQTEFSPLAPAYGDVAEEHLVSLLVLAPHLAGRQPARLLPEDFQRPECRELYRAVLAYAEGRATRPAPRPAADLPLADPRRDDPFRPLLDSTLVDFYDGVFTRARRWPAQTESQMEADLIGVVRRIRERNLHARLREAQYLLAEADAKEERMALAQQVERLAAQLGRVQLEQSRAALYTSPPG
jgi:DNA primase